MKLSQIKKHPLIEYKVDKKSFTAIETSSDFNFGFEIEALLPRVRKKEKNDIIKTEFKYINLYKSIFNVMVEINTLVKEAKRTLLSGSFPQHIEKEFEGIRYKVNSKIEDLFFANLPKNDEQKNLLIKNLEWIYPNKVGGEGVEEIYNDLVGKDGKRWYYTYEADCSEYVMDLLYGDDRKKFYIDNNIFDTSLQTFVWWKNEVYMIYKHYDDPFNIIGTTGHDYLSELIEEDTGISFDNKNKDYKQYKIIGDDSISGDNKYDFVASEIVSPILSLDNGLKDLKKLFNWIKENDGKTNHSTGFHVNLSIKGNPPMNFLKLIMLFNEEKILKDFKREDNGFTVPQRKLLRGIIDKNIENISKENIVEVERILSGKIKKEKYTGINLSKYEENNGHIEWRMMGNENYHLKYDEIRKRIVEMAFAMKVSSTDLYEKEYKKKLISFIEQSLNPENKRIFNEINSKEVLIELDILGLSDLMKKVLDSHKVGGEYWKYLLTTLLYELNSKPFTVKLQRLIISFLGEIGYDTNRITVTKYLKLMEKNKGFWDDVNKKYPMISDLNNKERKITFVASRIVDTFTKLLPVE